MLIYPPQSSGGGGGGGNATNTVLKLAYDPNAVVSTGGVYKTFPALWGAYLASKGPVDLYIAQGFVFPAGTYPLRPGTRVRGKFQQYGATTLLTAGPGVILEDWLLLDAVVVECTSDAPVMTFTESYPTMRLQNGATLRGNSGGTVPLIEWTTPGSSSGLSVDMQSGSRIENISGPVFNLEGTGPDGDKAIVSIRVGQKCYVSDDAVYSNTFAAIQPDLADGKGYFSFNQPHYDGDNSPLDPNSGLDLQLESGLQVRAFTITHPSGGGAPQWLQICRTVHTVDDTPVSFFPVQAPPPVITAGLDIRLVARHAATGDSAFWIIKGSVIFGFSGATLLPDPLQIDYYHASPGAASWTYQFLLNTPDPNNVNIQAIGEDGKDITWTMSLVEMLALAIP